MVLKVQVDALLQSQHDPYSLLHVQLVQTLKNDISRDVTEAFTASQPLVDQYPELYSSSSSFLDFLFKLCNVSSPPSPYYQGDDLQKRLVAKERELASKERELVSFEKKLKEKDSFYDTEKRDYEAQIKSWREKTIQCEATIKSLQENLLHMRENDNLDRGLFVHSNNYQIEKPPRQSALEFSSSDGVDTTCQTLEYPSQNKCVWGKMVEWKQELRLFLKQFKKDMSTNFTLTTEQNENISKLLETLHPVQPSSSEPSAESTMSVDEISTKSFDIFEQLLHRKLSKDHLKHMLKTFQLDEYFNCLESNIRGVMQSGKASLEKRLGRTARKQLVLAIGAPSNYEVTKVAENLPAICGVDADSKLKQERDQLKVERDQLNEENDQLKEERNQLKDEKAFDMIRPKPNTFSRLKEEIENLPPEQTKVRVYGKWFNVPRQIAFYGDKGLTYTFSDHAFEAKEPVPRRSK
ncbi:uncharacterized protein TNIN_184031 [Trichonephila inaurata madagascariensis]|uniref:Uncharacterized protein n=1 Tax=Trichonephila inaurata madagascariensis TaxID=2747483 RepID=A0A8X7CFE7_9ARAC|nr:uncharacterized protein TNIN_184031 [Trichonephila inaurata madagascariensis]